MLDIKTDLLAGPWHVENNVTVIRVTSPEQPNAAFAMLYTSPHRSRVQSAKMRATANVMLAGPVMLAALYAALIVLEDAYEDAKAVEENPQGDAVDHPIENAESTAACLAAWEGAKAAIAAAEGRV